MVAESVANIVHLLAIMQNKLHFFIRISELLHSDSKLAY
jgi:hypothetical protein